MRIYYSDHIEVPLPDGHRFPMAKYRRLRERLTAAPVGDLLPAMPAGDADLTRAHAPDYVARVKACLLTPQEARRIGFPNAPAMYQRARHSVGGTLCAARTALEDGVSVHLAGGTHHAHYNWGQGYCVFNDVIVAARALQHAGQADRVLIVDLDVHQGNGSATLTHGDRSIFTFSIHGARNFPFHKAQSDLDIGLADGTGDADYLDIVEESVWRVLAQARPDVVFYIAGADPYEGDRLGKLALSKAGLLQRDRLVLAGCREHDRPVVVVMGGGYAREIDDIVDIHAATVGVAAAFARQPVVGSS